jgi:hypothetical protein
VDFLLARGKKRVSRQEIIREFDQRDMLGSSMPLFFQKESPHLQDQARYYVGFSLAGRLTDWVWDVGWSSPQPVGLQTD